jgi:putative ABC transport system permease protein
VSWFSLTAKAGTDATDLEKRVRTLLSERHKIAPTDQTAIRGWNAGAQFAKTQRMFLAINVVLGAVGILSLLAGAIGVSNIMLISVRERTKEIGVRKALGAQPVSVVGMVIAESIVLTTIAGYLGLVFGVAFVELAAWGVAKQGPEFALGPPAVSLTAALIATGVLVLAGALAGLIPAYRAAMIQPVEALRDE